MWAHSRHVLVALFSLSLSWAGQNRTEETTWREALAAQFPGMLVGGCWSAFAWSLDTMFFLWSLPVAIPLLLAAPTAVFISRKGPGDALRGIDLLRVPEEREPLRPMLADARRFRQEKVTSDAWRPFEQAVLDPRLNRLHQALARDHRSGPRRRHLETAVARCLADGPDALNRGERSGLARDRQSLAALHAGAWRAPDNSYWGQCLRTKSLQGNAGSLAQPEGGAT
jgi:membrane glycosyltransferase